MIRWVFVLSATVLAVLAGSGAHGATGRAAAPPSGVTVVSFTFDGTFKSQDEFARILADHEMGGTFYVNSGYLDFPAYLTVDQLRSIARDRNEIGSASLFGNDLTGMPEAQARREVCDDRATLAQLGFETTSFAYPRGAQNPSVKAVVQGCGFNSGRRYTGLYEDATSCSACPPGETLPPADDFRIRTPPARTTVADLEAEVTRVERAGGGWLPLVFTKICVCPGDQEAISPTDFDAFATWLAKRPGTRVRTVDQVMGGPLKPVHGTPLKRLVPDPSAAISNKEPLSRQSAWTIAGLGIGQAQIIFTGVVASVAVVLTYRLATRGQRHGI